MIPSLSTANMKVTMDSEPRKQPHLVMLVANAVTGDSRVQKSALTAHKAGYRVTIVGLHRKGLATFDRIGPVPIYRTFSSYRRHSSWAARRKPESDWKQAAFADRTASNSYRRALIVTDYRAGRGRFTRSMPFIRPFAHQVTRTMRRLHPRLERAKALSSRPRAELSRRARIWAPNWRSTFPLIPDLEEAFVRALVELEPDLIHVHDCMPMPAADTYAAQMSSSRQVPWLYDSHEWIPGAFSPGIPQEAWIPAEAELIQRADAVITVTPDIAEMLQKRHKLRALPSVVGNAPPAQYTPMSPTERLPLREECQLDPDTPLLVYAGWLSESRGAEACVLALKNLPGVHMAFIAPQNAMREKIRAEASSVNAADRVHILDYVPADSLTWYIESATIGVCPLMHSPKQNHLAFPTKLREYIHANLPVLVSDARTQADFVRKTGVGEVFSAGEPESFATCVSKMLDNLEHYRSAITPELLRENSWEAQETILTDSWARLIPAPMEVLNPGNAQTFPKPRLAFANPGIPGIHSIGRSWADQTRGSYALLNQDVPPDASRIQPKKLSQALNLWLELTGGTDAVILDSTRPPFGNILGGLPNDVRTLQLAGLQVAAWAEPGRFDESEKVLALFPSHPYGEMEPGVRRMFDRQANRNRTILNSLPCPVLTSGRLAATQTVSGLWVPWAVPILEVRHQLSRRILVLHARRTQAELAMLEALETSLRGTDVTVERQQRHDLGRTPLEGFDIVIDALCLGEYTLEAARAMGSGCAVLGGINAFDSPSAVTEVTPETLLDAVHDVLVAMEEGGPAELSERSIIFARDLHDGRKTVACLQKALGIALPDNPDQFPAHDYHEAPDGKRPFSRALLDSAGI